MAKGMTVNKWKENMKGKVKMKSEEMRMEQEQGSFLEKDCKEKCREEDNFGTETKGVGSTAVDGGIELADGGIKNLAAVDDWIINGYYHYCRSSIKCL